MTRKPPGEDCLVERLGRQGVTRGERLIVVVGGGSAILLLVLRLFTGS